MNSLVGRVAFFGMTIARFSARGGSAPTLSPHPVRCPKAQGIGDSSAFCVVTGLSRQGDGRGVLVYRLGRGLSPKPRAAAFRSNTLSIFALIFASYSSIDWVTYSSPYLSIL